MHLKGVLWRYEFLFFKWEEPFFIVNYLENHFSENVDVLKSKFKLPSSYFTLCTKDNMSMIMGLEDIGAILVINVNL